MTMSFPAKPAACTSNMTVAFPAIVNDMQISCEISAEALQDHFEATSLACAALLDAFNRNRSQIEQVAARVVPVRAQAGRALLSTADF